ncbi:sex peptide receptor-like [Planococcus citri]|uniref:sex peptide receptor-like n=1 Tax=Planococcus citri TaxID=170843 RepID=UPI0031F7DCC0
MSTESPYYYCGTTLLEIGRYYDDYLYAYVTIVTCCIGVIFNLINSLVFTRKTMKSPPNLIFTHLAFVDLLQLLIRLLSASLKLTYDKNSEVRNTYAWLAFRKTYDACLATFHFISVFLTVQLAVWRYLGVDHPVKGRNWCNMRITRNVIVAGYVMCSISLGLPTFLAPEIKPKCENSTKFYTDDDWLMHEISAIVYGMMDRLIPSVFLAFLTYRIAVTLLARKTGRPPSASIRNGTRNAKTIQQINTSTTILFIVVGLFIIAEFPKGILSLLRMIYFEKSNQNPKGCYYSLISIFHSITNFNISITFIVYYTLSQQFRNTFKSLFCKTISETEDDSSPLPHLGDILVLTTSEITSSARTSTYIHL